MLWSTDVSPPRQSYTWWKIVLGTVLIYINVKFLLLPHSQAFQPDDRTQAVVLLVITGAMILVGGWLLVSGVRAGRPKPPFSS